MKPVETNEYGDLYESFMGKEWKLIRHGETILWGEGHLTVDIIEADKRGYELYVGENVAYDDIDHDGYLILPEGAIGEDGDVDASEPIGMALGDVKRKIVPAASPDVTAVRLGVDEELKGISAPK